jgi:hypothetical protein
MLTVIPQLENLRFPNAISASLQANRAPIPFPEDNSIWRSAVTIRSGAKARLRQFSQMSTPKLLGR